MNIKKTKKSRKPSQNVFKVNLSPVNGSDITCKQRKKYSQDSMFSDSTLNDQIMSIMIVRVVLLISNPDRRVDVTSKT